MNKGEQIKAIAKACGWTMICTREVQGENFFPYYGFKDPWDKKENEYERPLPDYLDDLNAMHEAESFLKGDQEINDYINNVYELHPGTSYGGWCKYEDVENDFCFMSAPAKIRAEAFLKAKKLWKEE